MTFWVRTLQNANPSFFLNPCQPEPVADPWPCWIFHYPTIWSSGQLGSIMFPPPSWPNPFVNNLGFPPIEYDSLIRKHLNWTCRNLQIPFLPPRAVSPNINQPFDSLQSFWPKYQLDVPVNCNPLKSKTQGLTLTQVVESGTLNQCFDRNINWLFLKVVTCWNPHGWLKDSTGAHRGSHPESGSILGPLYINPSNPHPPRILLHTLSTTQWQILVDKNYLTKINLNWTRTCLTKPDKKKTNKFSTDADVDWNQIPLLNWFFFCSKFPNAGFILVD